MCFHAEVQVGTQDLLLRSLNMLGGLLQWAYFQDFAADFQSDIYGDSCWARSSSWHWLSRDIRSA